MMKLIRCERGHYYDSTKHSSCPHCGVDIDLNISRTMPMGGKMQDSSTPKTEPRLNNLNIERRLNKEHQQEMFNKSNMGGEYEEDKKTVGIYHKKIGIDPVAGWLVCTEGADRGRDYRIRSGRNFIGRSEKMDIHITGDRTISRERHATVIYDPKKNAYLINPGDSREMVYLNGDGVYSATEIKAHDIIELGETKLMFIPLCGEEFKWEEKE